MSEMKLSRRQFVGGAAVAAAATAMPLAAGVSTAAATPTGTFPFSPTTWIPLDATLAARTAYEIYRAKYSTPASAQGG